MGLLWIIKAMVPVKPFKGVIYYWTMQIKGSPKHTCPPMDGSATEYISIGCYVVIEYIYTLKPNQEGS